LGEVLPDLQDRKIKTANLGRRDTLTMEAVPASETVTTIEQVVIYQRRVTIIFSAAETSEPHKVNVKKNHKAMPVTGCGNV
jgi:hypothetical protein